MELKTGRSENKYCIKNLQNDFIVKNDDADEDENETNVNYFNFSVFLLSMTQELFNDRNDFFLLSFYVEKKKKKNGKNTERTK